MYAKNNFTMIHNCNNTKLEQLILLKHKEIIKDKISDMQLQPNFSSQDSIN